MVSVEPLIEASQGPAGAHPWVAAGQDEVRFGIIGGPVEDWPRLLGLVRLAESLGADAYWLFDHPLDHADWATTLAALAVATDRIRLGTLVACPHYRSAILLANQAADIDRMSSGRFVLGLGVGDSRRDFDRMAMPFPPVDERLVYLRETIAVVRALLAGERVSFEGRFVRVREAAIEAPPVQTPYVPLLIAGGGERGTLPLAAELADMTNFGAFKAVGGAATLDDIRRKLAVIDARCAELGRPAGAVLRSHITLRSLLAPTRRRVEAKAAALPPGILGQYHLVDGLLATPEEAVPIYQALVDAGMRTFMLRIWEDDGETVRLFAEEVLPKLTIRDGIG